MEKPSDEDMARDAAADMAMCEAAGKGPWHVPNGVMTDDDEDHYCLIVKGPDYSIPAHVYGRRDRRARANFIAASRSALPAWIRRAVAAEAKLNLTYCAYCGFEVPCDDSAASRISEHIRTCEKHPMRELEGWMARLSVGESPVRVVVDEDGHTVCLRGPHVKEPGGVILRECRSPEDAEKFASEVRRALFGSGTDGA